MSNNNKPNGMTSQSGVSGETEDETEAMIEDMMTMTIADRRRKETSRQPGGSSLPWRYATRYKTV
ncbi:MAG: hypothetical protein LBK99_15400 [Opitutaceae bacterium]|nr:hypothetical protein [Opitutaceae bacterium]